MNQIFARFKVEVGGLQREPMDIQLAETGENLNFSQFRWCQHAKYSFLLPLERLLLR